MHFWRKSGRRPKTSPGLVGLGRVVVSGIRGPEFIFDKVFGVQIIFRAVVVAMLAERALPISEIHSSNEEISNIL